MSEQNIESGSQVSLHKTEEGAVIQINTDRFNFFCHRPFRESYKDLPADANVQVDFRKVHYMDSSALGMLLLLREHMGQDKEKVRFINCNESILNIFSVANFEKLFVL
jgi:HptB-dependent secretion and biofilm anti anti-sigma factor